MAEAREEMLRGVLGEIERLLVKLLMESERTTTSENMLLWNTSTDALTQSLPMASAALSTGDTMKQRYPLSPASPTEPPPLLSEEALCQKENSRHSNRSSNHSQKAEQPSKKSLRSVNIVDELYELDGSSLESLELFQLNECWDHMGDAHVSRFTRRASMAITAHSHMAISSPIIPIAQRRRCTAVKQVWASTFLFLILLELVHWPLIAFQTRYVGYMDFVKLCFELLSLPVSAAVAWATADTWLRLLGFGILEVILVATFAFDIISGADSALLRSAQLLRLLQLPRLYNMAGLARFLHLYSAKTSRELRALFNILIAGMMSAYFVHILTCLWFFVGNRSGGWVQQAGMTDLSLEAQYMMTVEWALSRIPPSRTSENMMLSLQSERALALVGTALSLLFGSIFTSIITNDISDVRRVRRLQRESEHQVFDFLTVFPVRWDLELQLKEYLKRNRSTIQLPRKQDMASLLPEHLFSELCREAMAPILDNHNFLRGMGVRFPAFRHDLCVKGFTDWNVANQEILFSPGPKCDNMLFVAYGTVRYTCKADSEERMQPVPSTFSMPKSCSTILSSGDSLCEACIWTAWHYVGKATANSRAALLCLSLESLKSLVSVHKEAASELVVYARVYVHKLNDIEEDKELTDLYIPVDYNRQLFHRAKSPEG